MIFQNFGYNRVIPKVAAGGNTFNYPSGAFAIYDFGNPSSYSGSGTTVYDVSGNGRNATLRNTPTYSSANGGIMQFVQASSQYMDYQGYMARNVSAVIIWKNTDTTFQKYAGWPNARINYGLIWTNDVGSAPYNKQFVPLVGDKVGNLSAAGSTYIGPSDITIFHQYSVTVESIDSTTTPVNTYLDSGATTASQSLNLDRTGTPSTADQTIYLNRDTAVGDRYGNGYMMAYLHYNRVLTSTEISNIYNNFLNRF